MLAMHVNDIESNRITDYLRTVLMLAMLVRIGITD